MLIVVGIHADVYSLVYVSGKRVKVEEFFALLKIKVSPVSQMVVLHIRARRSEHELLVVVLFSNPPQTIVFIDPACILLALFVPCVTLVTPWTVVAFLTPRVSNLNKLCTVFEFQRVVDSERMVVRYSKLVFIVVVACTGLTDGGDNPVLSQLRIDVVPDFIDTVTLVRSVEVGRSCQHLNSRTHPATRKHFVVSEQFGGGLLKDRHPQGTIIAHRTVDKRLGGFVPERQLVINGHSDGDTQDVESQGVDTS